MAKKKTLTKRLKDDILWLQLIVVLYELKNIIFDLATTLTTAFASAEKKHAAAFIATFGVVLSFAVVGATVTPHQMGQPAQLPFIGTIDVTTPKLPTPPSLNNTTQNKTPPICPTCPLRMAAAGDIRLLTPSELDKLKALGIVEIHVVVPDAGTYPDVLTNIQKRGMVAVYDGEVPFWINHNSNSQFSSSEVAALQAIYNAGWHNFASEGLYAIQVAQIDGVGFHYYNYGGDMGENLYTNGNFGPHQAGSHYANYMEAYDVNLKSTIYSTILYQETKTPGHNGILFGLWVNTRTGGQNVALQSGTAAAWIKDLNTKGAKITTVLWWCGLSQYPSYWLNGQFKTAYTQVKALRF